MQDREIFIRLLDARGEEKRFTPDAGAEIFDALVKEVPAYQGLSYAAIGDQRGRFNGGGVAEHHDR